MTVAQEIDGLRAAMGRKLLILGHYYQADEVLEHADYTGDSLDLARRAAHEEEARMIVFCGVHFMAESADLLSGREQVVSLPDPMASCPMALMVRPDALERAWAFLRTQGDDWVPVTYVNSTAAVKAFCGAHGGLCCTSANAAAVFRSVFDGGKRLFFMPDEHLGVNVTTTLGLSESDRAVYDPGRRHGGLTAETLAGVQAVLWKGFCIVHLRFRREDIERVRAEHPGVRIIVHPETPAEAARLADAQGSTSQIIRYVEEAPAGSTVAVGTEINLVRRLARLHGGRVSVFPLGESACRNMAMITPEKLLHTLKERPAVCTVRVPDEYREPARLALERMLTL